MRSAAVLAMDRVCYDTLELDGDETSWLLTHWMRDTDDLWRESIAVIALALARHRLSLQTAAST